MKTRSSVKSSPRCAVGPLPRDLVEPSHRCVIGSFPRNPLQRFSDSTIQSLAVFLLLTCLGIAAEAQYAIDWYKISGGGGTSTGGVYSISATIGQHDAGATMTGGNYSLTGGFWSLLSVVQTPGLPSLIITHSGNSVIVSWPDPATNTYTLQQNSSLASTNGWATSIFTLRSANGTNSITIAPPTANLFFRLKQ